MVKNTTFEKQQRQDIYAGAMSHIRSIIVGLKKFKAGSDAEEEYTISHASVLIRYYLRKLSSIRKREFF